MIKKLLINLLYLVAIALVTSCAQHKYVNTPYYDEKLSNTQKKYLDNNSNDYKLHLEFATSYFDKQHYGTALYALSEAHRLAPNNDVVNYNIAVLLSLFGFRNESASRMLYVEHITKDYFLRNKAVSALLLLENKKQLPKEYYYEIEPF